MLEDRHRHRIADTELVVDRRRRYLPSKNPEGFSNGNPGQPRAERTITAMGREAPDGDDHRALGCVVGIARLAEDLEARPKDGARLAFDEQPAGRLVLAEDCGAQVDVVHWVIIDRRQRSDEDPNGRDDWLVVPSRDGSMREGDRCALPLRRQRRLLDDEPNAEPLRPSEMRSTRCCMLTHDTARRLRPFERSGPRSPGRPRRSKRWSRSPGS